ncbi:hypothetical protein ACFB49_18700 [Sphingomonas sp. DBB INV C78]|uniref:hypothetical protein n=1 Tax=Sphingomonas sp. DBB INV C78 TaxID=3349434 RepID=UPI0036D322C9
MAWARLPVRCGTRKTPAMTAGRFFALTIAAIMMIVRVGPGCYPAAAMPSTAMAATHDADCHGDTAPKGAKSDAASQICLMACGLAMSDEPAPLIASALRAGMPTSSPPRPLSGIDARPSIPPPRLA